MRAGAAFAAIFFSMACGGGDAGPTDASAEAEAGIPCWSDLATPDQTCGTLSWATSDTKSRLRNHHATYVTHASDGSSFIVAIAGVNVNTELNDVDIAPIAADGTLGAFTSGPKYPQLVGGLTGANANGVIVGAGGMTGAGHSAQVYTSVVQSDGSLGAWQRVAAMNEERMHAASFASGSRIWILGGFSDVVYDDMIFADVGSDGSIAAWSDAGKLPGPMTHFSIAAAQGYAFATGGLDQVPTSNPPMSKKVYRGVIEPSGAIDTWTAMTTLPAGVCTHSSFVYGGYLYIAGGIDDSPAQLSTVRRASIASDMTLGAWEDVLSLPIARGHVHMTPVVGTHVYSISGAIDFSLNSTDAVFVGSFL